MSLLFLWDAWQRHNGQPSLFGPAPTKQAAPAGSDGPTATPKTSDASIPSAPSASGAVPGSNGGGAVPAAAAGKQAGGQSVTVATTC